MKLFRSHIRSGPLLPLLSLSLALVCSAAVAGKPEWAGHGKGNSKGEGGDQQQAQSGGTTVEIRIGAYF